MGIRYEIPYFWTMNLIKLFIGFFFCLFALSTNVFGQDIPIGNWRTHYTYNTAQSIEIVEQKLFSGSNHLSVFDMVEDEYTTYSKVNGMSDVDIKLIRYDAESGYLIIIYQNSNLDLFKEGEFYNIPDIKNQNITGSKRINSVYFKNKLMYLSTDFGIVVLNPARKEIKETYKLQAEAQLLEIKDLTSLQGKFYAATSKGLFMADVNSPALQNYANWSLVLSDPLQYVVNHYDTLYAATATTLSVVRGNLLASRYTSPSQIVAIRSGVKDLYLCESGDQRRAITFFNEFGQKSDSVMNINPNDMVERNSGEIWEADEWEGTIQLTNRKNKQYRNPKGIFTNSVYNLSYFKEDILVAGGGETEWIYNFNSAGISRLKPSGEWQWYNRFTNIPAMDSVFDILDVAIDPRNNYIYATSFGGGLLEIHPDLSTVVYKNTPYILPFGSSYRMVGLTFDERNNLWMSNYGSESQLVVKKADGSWQNFKFPYGVSEKAASQIVIDDANQKWVVAPRGIGIYVLNDNNTIDNKNDDKIKFVRTGLGSGNLPSNEVNCIAKDKNGKLWVGTDDGIGIFNCPESVTTTSGCEAELKVVQYDQDAGQLFQRENVRTIAVDGANNKWIGTNNGIWLISDDAEKILQRFNTSNSPLPSNEINKILIHPITGEVFIATNAGLVSYRGQATDGAENQDGLTVFPNPVPSGYAGSIAIKGLVENSDVRITDAAGQLIYKTKAQGGQAVWNGQYYTGGRPKTGVCFVFVTNEDGSETKVGKFIFNE